MKKIICLMLLAMCQNGFAAGTLFTLGNGNTTVEQGQIKEVALDNGMADVIMTTENAICVITGVVAPVHYVDLISSGRNVEVLCKAMLPKPDRGGTAPRVRTGQYTITVRQ